MRKRVSITPRQPRCIELNTRPLRRVHPVSAAGSAAPAAPSEEEKVVFHRCPPKRVMRDSGASVIGSATSRGVVYKIGTGIGHWYLAQRVERGVVIVDFPSKVAAERVCKQLAADGSLAGYGWIEHIIGFDEDDGAVLAEV